MKLNFSNIFLALSLLLCTCHISAQALQKFEGDYLPFGLGGSYTVFLDNFNSPLVYEGWNGLLQSGYYYQDEKWQNILYLNGGLGFAAPRLDEASPSQYTNYLADITYQLRYRVWNTAHQQAFAGLVNHNTWAYRQHNRFRNSAETFTGLFSFGLSGNYQRQFNLRLFKKTFDLGLDFTANLPLASYVIRPGYVTQTIADAPAVKELRWIDDLVHVNMQTELVWFRKNGNQLRLSYRWDYAQVEAPITTQQASHQLFISSYFRF